MSEFLGSLRERAHKRPRRVLFPESNDSRVLDAARGLQQEGLAAPILIRQAVGNNNGEGGEELTFAEIDEKKAAELENLLLMLRKEKGLSAEVARELARDPLVYGMYLLRLGEADALVAGVTRPTADVIRAGLWLIGMKEGVRTISSSFYMVIPPFRGDVSGSREEVLTFTDCGVVPNPTSEQLADIAIAAADARTFIVGDVPQVAFLSYSTLGSGGDKELSVQRVREALALVKQKRPDIAADGELQGDAALMPDIAGRKAPESAVAGRANVLVFPDLNSANIAYKLVERLVPGSYALGPVLHGLRKPVSDVSRGADADSIKNIALIAALQAEN